MQEPPKPDNEDERLQALWRADLLDTVPEEIFDRLTRIASRVAGVPIALISLVDDGRQWFKSKVGLDAEETPRDVAFCAHAILQEGPFCVPDASRDPRFSDNPLVAEEPGIRFYLGIPLEISEGIRIGTLCVIDTEPRELEPYKVETLRSLAEVACEEIRRRSAAEVDPLTQTHSRQLLDSMMQREMERVAREQSAFCVAILDVDHFDAIIDKHGPDFSDAVLQHVAAGIRSALAPSHTLFNLGGREMAVLLVGAGLDVGQRAMEAVCSAVEAAGFELGGIVVPTTISVGLAQCRDDDESPFAIVSRADDALFLARARGGNQVAVRPEVVAAYGLGPGVI